MAFARVPPQASSISSPWAPIANIFNLCAITMPIKKDYWFSFSLLAQAKEDKKLLCEAKVIECIINNY